ncbi:MAG: hypothetical protein K2R98_30975 [Gemmataceae bacterium]|nr:hypothetical protein [Gemmataceae bacterium]
MLRLAVFGVDEPCHQEIAPRLRGAELCSERAHAVDALLSTCDAAVFFGSPIRDDSPLDRFLLAGRPVLLAAECLSKQRLQALHVRAISDGACLAMVNLQRYLPSRQLIQQQLDAGKLGEPGLVRVHRWADSLDMRNAPLGDLELVNGYFGRPPNLVYAVEQGPGTLHLHLGFAGGGMALLDYAGGIGESYGSLSVIGSRGAAYADDHANMQMLLRDRSARAVRAEEGVIPWCLAIQEFIDALNQGRDLSMDRTAWRQVFAVWDAVELSLRTRQAVVPEEVR